MEPLNITLADVKHVSGDLLAVPVHLVTRLWFPFYCLCLTQLPCMSCAGSFLDGTNVSQVSPGLDTGLLICTGTVCLDQRVWHWDYAIGWMFCVQALRLIWHWT